MATHFICQSTEPLPHNYPTGLAEKSHGAVSQYEVYNAADKAHTRFPPPGWDFSLTSEEDSLPLLQTVPQPSWRNTSFQPDPDLCITPQKPVGKGQSKVSASALYEKPQVNPDPLLTLTPDKSLNESSKGDNRNENIHDKNRKHRVRFDLEEINEDDLGDSGNDNFESKSPKKSYSKPYQPELYGDEGDDRDDEANIQEAKESLGISKNSRTVKYKVGKVNGQSVYVPMSGEETDTSENNSAVSRQTLKTVPQKSSMPASSSSVKTVKVICEKSKIDKSDSENFDPIANSKIPEENGPKRKVKVLRENQYTPKPSEYTFPFNHDPSDYAGGNEHMFARPEYNSTLRMKLAAEKMKDSEVDIDTALQRKLKMSESTRADINEKAASQVNTEGSQYSGLVSLALPAEEICRQAAEVKTARAKQTKPKSKPKDMKEPDLMEFFTSDRQKESVTYVLPCIPPPSEKLSKASNWRAFDLYKHNRVWEGRGMSK